MPPRQITLGDIVGEIQVGLDLTSKRMDREHEPVDLSPELAGDQATRLLERRIRLSTDQRRDALRLVEAQPPVFEGPSAERTRIRGDGTERQQPLHDAANIELSAMHMQFDHILAGERARSGHSHDQRILISDLTEI